MNMYHIDLTDDEATLVAEIDFCKSHPNHGRARAAYEANKASIPILLRSLIERRAIPQERMNYWNDPAYNMNRIKASNKGVFERNGCTGQDIYTHPHFIPYLRYFLFGADLPDAVIAKFETMIGSTGFVTSGDIVPISKYARELARQHCLDQAHVPEEFFKLCLDMGLGLDIAANVMRSVKQIRWRN